MDTLDKDIENFEIRNTDVIVASFPKSGTTWAQEMVWLIKNKLDYEGAQVKIQQRFPMLEMCLLLNDPSSSYSKKLTAEWMIDSVNYMKKLPDIRYIKTHLQYSSMPKDIRNGLKSPKIVYVLRNPKDVFISYYNHRKLLTNYTGSLDEFAIDFFAGTVYFGEYWTHVFGYYNMRHLPNLLIIKYEDMKKDLESVIRQVCTFLEEDQLTKKDMQSLCTHLDFDQMKDNDAVNYMNIANPENKNDKQCQGRFMRYGQIGRYKEEMSPELITKFDAWIRKNIANTDFDEKYACNI